MRGYTAEETASYIDVLPNRALIYNVEEEPNTYRKSQTLHPRDGVAVVVNVRNCYTKYAADKLVAYVSCVPLEFQLNITPRNVIVTLKGNIRQTKG